MVSQEIIEIILRAQDNASNTINKTKQNMEDMGNTSKRTFENTTRVSMATRNALYKIRDAVRTVRDTMGTIQNAVNPAFTAIQNAVTSATNKIKSMGNAFLDAHPKINNLAQTIKTRLETAVDAVKSKFKSLSETTAFTVLSNKVSAVSNKIQTSFHNAFYNNGIWNAMMTLAGKVDSAINPMIRKFNSLKTQANNAFNSIKATGSAALNTLKSKAESLSESFNGMGGIISSALGGLGMSSITQLTVGLSLSREKMSTLNAAIMGSKTSSDALLSSLDKMTNNSVVGMDEMVNALNKIKLSTSMSNEQLNGTKEAVMKLGEASILMGNDASTAGYQMGEAFSGLNGDFQILKENFGITKEKMMEMGWSGEASDVEGYTRALEGCLDQCGDLSKVMETTSGKLAIIQKAFRVAGRSLGDMLLPVIGTLAAAFITLNNTCPMITQALIVVAAAISGFAILAPTLGPIITAFSALSGVIKTVVTAVRLLSLALLTNPWGWVVIAIVAVVAILAHLYRTNEQVRNGLNAIGSVISGGLMAAWNALVWVCQTVYLALLHLGQYIYSHLVPAWNTMKSTLSPLVPTFQHLWSVLQRLWTVLTGSSEGATAAGVGFGILEIAGKLLGAIITALIDIIVGVVNILLAVLVPAITFVTDYISALINFITSLAEAFSLLLQGDVVGFFTTLGGAIATAFVSVMTSTVSFFTQILTNLDNVFGNVFSKTLAWFVQLAGAAWNGITQFCSNIITGLTQLPGQIVIWLTNFWVTISTWGNQILMNLGLWFNSLITTLLMWGTQIWTNLSLWFAQLVIGFTTWLTQIWTNISLWVSQIVLLAWNAGSQFVTSIINWLIQLPGQVWTWLLSTLNRVYLWLASWGISAITAGTRFVNNVVNYIRTLPSKVWTWLLNTLNKAISWASSMANKASQAGNQFIQRFINFIRTLPTRLWLYLNYALEKVNLFKNVVVARIQQAGRNMVTNFAKSIQNLPKVMWDELMRVKDKILSGNGPLGSAIRNLGSNLLKNFKSALGINSPGYMFYAIEGEMERIDNNLIKNQSTLSKQAQSVGESMIKGFDKNNYEQMNNVFTQATDSLKMPEIDMSNVQQTTQQALVTQETLFQQQTTTANGEQQQPTTTGDGTLTNQVIQIPAEQITADTTQVSMAITTMANTINPQLTSVTTALNTLSTTSTQNKMTLLNNNLQTIQSLNQLTTVGTQSMQKAVQNNNTTIQSYKTMNTRINAMLTDIQNKNRTGWTNVKTTTQNNLNSMLSSTRSVTAQMVSAWNSMKNSIVSAAESIRSQSTDRFNRLWSTIKTFYNRIRNPGGAGPASRATRSRVKRTRASGSIASKVSNGLQSIVKPRRNTVTATQVRPLIPEIDMEYVLPNGTGSSMPTKDIIRYMNNPNLGAGWSNIIKPNTNYIRNKSNEWKANGPKVFGKYPTGNDLFKVKEFESGTPRVSFATFKKMAENVFSNINYDFYWDSEKYGSWQAAAMSGNMNCSDSTDFIVALAHACGLSASKVHGFWNNLGHFWAVIDGHKMDTTGFMLGKGWTPSQSHAGPAPSGFNFGTTDTSDSVVHSGSIDFNLSITVDGNGNVDSEVIKEGVENALTDKELLKQIATSPDFQAYDNRTKIQMNRQLRRVG